MSSGAGGAAADAETGDLQGRSGPPGGLRQRNAPTGGAGWCEMEGAVEVPGWAGGIDVHGGSQSRCLD